MSVDTSMPLPQVDEVVASNVAALARVLADPVRVRILDVLRGRDGEACQCELGELFAIAQPTLSHHLRKLQDAGLIGVERRGRWAYYSLRPEPLESLSAWLSSGPRSH
jgi:ArsR family transcriptional regulator, arsenate/arsenite/antimonite-responsive transcriptional repressor